MSYDKQKRTGGYSVWNTRFVTDTKNFGGREWVVDGENGRWNYPGDWPVERAENMYRRGEAYTPLEYEGVGFHQFNW